jgi:hypothetical protein
MSFNARVGRMLLPGRLTAAARRVPAADYSARSGCSTVLLLRVPDEEQELAWGLNQTYGVEAELAAEQPKVLDFHTAFAGAGTGTSLRAGARGFGHDDLIGWIAAARCFALPLVPREGAFSGRISIGRAVNKDLSLRSQNISKLHAWFEYDPAGKLLIADAGSKNGTKVGGVRLTPRQPVPIASGTEIRFGPLEAMICPIEQFWEVASML